MGRAFLPIVPEVFLPSSAEVEAPTTIQSGILIANKPRGQTSRWVVDQVKRLVRPAKVGHAGTLDPLATGVLLVCIGGATRLVDYIHELAKQYRAEFLLGRTSPTEDIDGDINELRDAPIPARAELDAAARRFVGEIAQRPPEYSAIKVRGQRSYSLARQGREVEHVARPVTIHGLEIVEYDYPRLVLGVECSTGTYVRSLGRDLAESLGTGAVMSALERTAIGQFHVNDAIDVAQLTLANLRHSLQPPAAAVAHLPTLVFPAAEVAHISHGRAVRCSTDAARMLKSAASAAFDESGNLLAILRLRPDGLLGVETNLIAV